MNLFELQAQITRHWFDVAQTMTAATMSACAAANEHAATFWGRSLPWQFPATPAPTPFAPFPWATSAWPTMMPSPGSWGFSAPLATNPWSANPFTAWMTAFTGPASYTTTPFATGMTSLWAPWTFAFAPPASPMSWASPFSMPSRNPSADLLEQMATNYRTASGYAVAAVIGPLNAALDPRTYGEPWWQRLEKPKKLN
jgi:hypothetical protein